MKTSHCIIPATVALLLLTSCEFNNASTGPLETMPVNIDGGDAERVNIELDMGAGQMNVEGGGKSLLDGNVEYNVSSMKPLITSSHNGVHAMVKMKQPDSLHGGNIHYVWNLQLANKFVTDLTVNCGAGQAKLDVGTINLRFLQVHMGAGQVDLDLTGTPTRDYEVKINGGVGQANVRLPQNVGLWASAHGGIGSIKVEGLEKQGDHWQNDLYDKSKVNVKIEVNGGIGEIRLIS